MAGSCEGSSRGRSKGGCANVAPDRNDPLGSDARLCDDDLALVLGVDERLHGLRIVVAELGRLFDVDRLSVDERHDISVGLEVTAFTQISQRGTPVLTIPAVDCAIGLSE